MVVLSNLEIGASMSGPSIRCWNFARLLSEAHDVTLAAPNRCELPAGNSRLLAYEQADPLTDLLGQADFVIAQALGPRQVRSALTAGTRIVYDAYDPVVFEGLRADHSSERRTYREVAVHQAATDMMLLAATKIICASARQRDLWYGSLASLGRLAIEPNPEGLVSVVPFGLPDEPPADEPLRLRRDFGLTDHDFVVVWAGGVWPWLDPWTPLQAMERLATSAPHARLVILGTQRPGATAFERRIAESFERRAGGHGWVTPNVYVNRGWVPYQLRGSYLCDADAAISMAEESLETRYAFRTRVLDHLWCGLPSILSSGDELAERGGRDGWAVVVAPGDVGATAQAILDIAGNTHLGTDLRAKARTAAQGLRWSQAVGPLKTIIEDVSAPARAFDGRVRSATYELYRRKIANPRSVKDAVSARTHRIMSRGIKSERPDANGEPSGQTRW